MPSVLHATDVYPGPQAPSAVVVLVASRHVEPARSRGLPAVAIPDDRVDPQWPRRLAGRYVTVVMEADPASRAYVERIAADLERAEAMVAVADFAPQRDDGYGLSDWLGDHPTLSARALLHLVAPSSVALPSLVAAA